MNKKGKHSKKKEPKHKLKINWVDPPGQQEETDKLMAALSKPSKVSGDPPKASKPKAPK